MPRRDRLRRRSPAARWLRRVLGLLGAAAVLGAGAVAATLIVSAAAAGDEDAVSAPPSATPTPAPDRGERAAPGRPRLTAAQRETRRRALDEVRRQGYSPVRIADYELDHLLRVLIGKPAGTTPPGLRAFFFADGEYVGSDAPTGSAKLRAGRRREREITLVYTLYVPGDRACCPKGGDTRVHFRWADGALQPREPVPPPLARLLPD